MQSHTHSSLVVKAEIEGQSNSILHPFHIKDLKPLQENINISLQAALVSKGIFNSGIKILY